MQQIYFGERIAAARRAQGLTQEALAQRLGVTNQAVSKWESDQCCPDIMLLPALADIFGITLDELFGRAVPVSPSAAGLPWPDDDDLRAVCYHGHRLIGHDRIPGDRPKSVSEWLGRHLHIGVGGAEFDYRPAELHFSGNVRDIHAAFAVICTDTAVAGNVEAGDSVTCGDVGGNVKAGDSVRCGSVGGSVSSGDSIDCGDIRGNANAGDSIRCGAIGGSASAGDSVYQR